MSSWVSSQIGPIDSKTIDEQYREYKQAAIRKGSNANESYLNEARQQGNNFGVNVQSGANFERESQGFYDSKKEDVTFQRPDFSATQSKLTNTSAEISEQKEDMKDSYLEKKDSSVLWRATKKGAIETGDSALKITNHVLDIPKSEKKDDF
jgi:hypothetical protein